MQNKISDKTTKKKKQNYIPADKHGSTMQQAKTM